MQPAAQPELPGLEETVIDAYEKAGARLLAIVRDAVLANGKLSDDMAADLGIDGGHFSRALRDAGTHFSVTWLPAVMRRDRSRSIARYLAALCGCELVLRPSLTPEQRLARLEHACRESGAAGEAILRQAEEGP